MGIKVWIDGKLYDKENAKISVYDHGLLYGDGVFEGIRAYGGKVLEVDTHLRRLYESAKAIRLAIPMTRAQMKAAIAQTMKANSLKDCYIRLVVTRGVGFLGVDPSNCRAPSVIIITDKIQIYPAEMYAKGMSVITSSILRNHPASLPSRIKSLNYLNNILARIEADDAGVSEAIMLNYQGNVAECTADNLFVVKNGRVMTPGIAEGILEGVTRGLILELCKRLRIPCTEQVVQRHDVYVADECFASGTGAEIVPITKVDGRTIGDGQVGPITKNLIAAFNKRVGRPSAS
jgi:branched-chain amino acid aminotransferase